MTIKAQVYGQFGALLWVSDDRCVQTRPFVTDPAVRLDVRFGHNSGECVMLTPREARELAHALVAVAEAQEL